MLDPTSSVWISNLPSGYTFKTNQRILPCSSCGAFQVFQSHRCTITQTGPSRTCHMHAFVQAASKHIRIVAWLPSQFPFLCGAIFLFWWPWLMPSDYPPFWVSTAPSYHPCSLNHVPQLLTAVISLTPPPAACCFYVIFFPLKLLSSYAKIDFPCPLQWDPPQPSPLASSSLIQNPCQRKDSKAGEWSRKHVLGGAAEETVSRSSFHPGIVQGSICKRVSLVIQAVQRELIKNKICILEVYYLPMKCWACFSCCPLSSVLSQVLEIWQLRASLVALCLNHYTTTLWGSTSKQNSPGHTDSLLGIVSFSFLMELMTVLKKQSTPWQVTLFLLAGHLGSLIIKIQVLIISTD